MAFVVLSLTTTSEILSPPRLTGSDLTPDYVSTKAWRSGDDPYRPLSGLFDHYLGERATYYHPQLAIQRNAHPPLQLILLSPLSFFPFYEARLIWLVVSALAFATMIHWLARFAGWTSRTSWLLAIGLISLPPFRSDLALGQVNWVVLALLILAWRCFARERSVSGGVLLGAAAALKFFPILWLIPLVRGRRWRATGVSIASAVLLMLGSAAAIGREHFETFVNEASSYNGRFWVPAPHNKSLLGIPARWLAPNDWIEPVIRAPLAALLVSLAFVFTLLFVFWRRTPAITGDWYWDGLPFFLLVNPLFWDHYLTILIPMMLLLSRKLLGVEGPLRILAIVAIALVAMGDAVAYRLLEWTQAGPTGMLVYILGWQLAQYGVIALCVFGVLGAARRSVHGHPGSGAEPAPLT